ncbi:hypothetical protein NliqN6_3322 [Naganishia liquefaciens]|uniref:CREG-like beta-barrel domain-containing protein n=1 Tax=Naganishia liquefaciens TaxID=104408 RepID=A0A8H3YES9_9TREE|nr:hypothetical protein NliqN6_3322 [Naganishia liquefaciens]
MNHSATYMLKEPYNMKPLGRTSPMDHGRVSLIGNMTILNDISSDESKALARCYERYHPDAKAWLPGADDSPHYSVWARFDVHDAYYVGGFGDTHYIGHITPQELA